MVKRPGATHVMTHHGTPLKKMGLDQAQHPVAATDSDFAAQMRRVDRWDYSVTANAHTTVAWDGAYPAGYRTLEVGYPRNDRLALAGPEEIARVRTQLGIASDERVVLYAPTHREWLPTGTPVLDVDDRGIAVAPLGLHQCSSLGRTEIHDRPRQGGREVYGGLGGQRRGERTRRQQARHH